MSQVQAKSILLTNPRKQNRRYFIVDPIKTSRPLTQEQINCSDICQFRSRLCLDSAEFNTSGNQSEERTMCRRVKLSCEIKYVTQREKPPEKAGIPSEKAKG